MADSLAMAPWQPFLRRGHGPQRLPFPQARPTPCAPRAAAPPAPRRTGLPCDREHSTCGDGSNAMCWGRGPGWPDDFKSTEIIGRRQADKAKELWSAPGRPLAGPIDARHAWVDMSAVEVKASRWTRAGRTCKGAMGFAFAAGTTDGGRRGWEGGGEAASALGGSRRGCAPSRGRWHRAMDEQRGTLNH
jgi:hypothetical protein